MGSVQQKLAAVCCRAARATILLHGKWCVCWGQITYGYCLRKNSRPPTQILTEQYFPWWTHRTWGFAHQPCSLRNVILCFSGMMMPTSKAHKSLKARISVDSLKSYKMFWPHQCKHCLSVGKFRNAKCLHSVDLEWAESPVIKEFTLSWFWGARPSRWAGERVFLGGQAHSLGPYRSSPSLRAVHVVSSDLPASHPPLRAFQVTQWWRTHLQCRRHRFSPWVGKIPWRMQW